MISWMVYISINPFCWMLMVSVLCGWYLPKDRLVIGFAELTLLAGKQPGPRPQPPERPPVPGRPYVAGPEDASVPQQHHARRSRHPRRPRALHAQEHQQGTQPEEGSPRKGTLLAPVRLERQRTTGPGRTSYRAIPHPVRRSRLLGPIPESSPGHLSFVSRSCGSVFFFPGTVGAVTRE
jgi:hypothetical protein